MANLATKAGVEGTQRLTIHAPLMQLTKAEHHPPRARARRRLRRDAELLRPDARGPRLRRVRCLPAAAAGLRRGRRARPRRLPAGCGGAMTYAVKEIFYTLQGEGPTPGGRRCSAASPAATSGSGTRRTGPPPSARSATPTSSAPTAPAAASSAPPRSSPTPSPSTWPSRRRARHAARGVHRRRAAAADRRGARRRPARGGLRDRRRDQRHAACRPTGIDWICVSPKAGSSTVLLRGDELKLVYPQAGRPAGALRGRSTSSTSSCSRWTAPSSTRTSRAAVAYCLEHPQWRLSLQTHKYLGIR